MRHMKKKVIPMHRPEFKIEYASSEYDGLIPIIRKDGCPTIQLYMNNSAGVKGDTGKGIVHAYCPPWTANQVKSFIGALYDSSTTNVFYESSITRIDIKYFNGKTIEVGDSVLWVLQGEGENMLAYFASSYITSIGENIVNTAVQCDSIVKFTLGDQSVKSLAEAIINIVSNPSTKNEEAISDNFKDLISNTVLGEIGGYSVITDLSNRIKSVSNNLAALEKSLGDRISALESKNYAVISYGEDEPLSTTEGNVYCQFTTK